MKSTFVSSNAVAIPVNGENAYIINYSTEGITHWFKVVITKYRESYSRETPGKRQVPYLGIMFWFVITGLMIGNLFVFSDNSQNEFALQVNAIVSVFLLLGVYYGFSKYSKRLILLNPVGSGIKFPLFHIISLRDDISTPGVKDGLFSYPSSWLMGYRIRSFQSPSKSSTSTVGFSLKMIFSDKMFSITPDRSIHVANGSQLFDAVKFSLNKIGRDTENKLDLDRGWLLRGIPSDRPVEEITSQMNFFIAKRAEDDEIRLTDITGYSNYSSVLVCNECKKCFLPEDVCLKSTSEPIFQCHNCLKKKIILDLKKHNNSNDFYNSFPKNLFKILDSNEEEESLAFNMSIFISVCLCPILIFLAIGFAFLPIFLPIITIVVIFLFGFLISNTNLGYPNLKQILTCHNGITAAKMGAFQEVFHLNLDITMMNSKGRINVFLFSAIFTFIEIFGIFYFFPDFITSLLVSNGLMETILLYFIPASITLIAFFLGNMYMLESTVFINYLNIYIFDEEEFTGRN